MNRAQQQRRKIFQDTLRLTKGLGSYKQSAKYDAEELPELEQIQDKGDDCYRDLKQHNVVVEVVNQDTLVGVLELANEELNPLVLNLASNFKAGGGVRSGAGAQEEELFRRTNYDNCTNQSFYPLKNPDEFVVTENVYIVKDENSVVLDKKDWQCFTFLAMPAIKRPICEPAYDEDDEPINNANGKPVMTYRDKEDLETMREKIDLIFRYAVLEEFDSLVLGALGCGAYGNPPEDVAELFKEAIETYGGAFKKIRFSVLSRDDQLNHQIFKETIDNLDLERVEEEEENEEEDEQYE